MSSVLFIAAASAGIALTCGACGDDGPVDEQDGGAEVDGGSDAGRDSGPEDSGADVGPDLGDLEFVIPNGVPSGCDFRMAAHPERMEPMTWSAIEDGPEGFQLDVPWGDSTQRGVFVVNQYPNGPGNSPPVLVVQRPIDTLSYDTEAIGFSPDGAIEIAFRFAELTDRCKPGIAMSINRSRITLAPFLPERIRPPEFVVLNGPIDDPSAFEPTVVTRAETTNSASVQRMSLGPSGTVGLEVITALRAASVRDGVFRILPRSASTQTPVVVDDAVLYRENINPRRYLAEMPDGSTGPFLERTDADVMFLTSDGESIAWMEGRDRIDSSTHWARRTVFVAPFVSDPSLMDPQLVVELGEGYPTTLGLGGGWLVTRHPTDVPKSMIAIELASGRQLTFSAPEGEMLRDILYVTDEEVAFTVSNIDTRIDRTIWRVALPTE